MITSGLNEKNSCCMHCNEISAVRIVFFHFESNRIVELLFEISNRIGIVIVGLKNHQY